MGSFVEEIEESRFFDALDNITSEPESMSCSKNRDYDVWINAPQSVGERRRKFIKWMRLFEDDSFRGDFDRIVENSGTVLRTSIQENEFFSSRSSVSSWNANDSSEPRIENANSSSDLVMENEGVVESREIESISPNSLREIALREIVLNSHSPRKIDRLRDKFLSRLRSMTCTMSPQVKNDNVGPENLDTKIQRVGVRYYRKKLKELSALFTGQEIQAHEGSIITMKFSLDEQYLASAGEDKLVKIWRVIEDERLDEIDIPEADPSCVYFCVNKHSELGEIMVEKDKISKSKNLKKSPDSACVIFPPKVFRIVETPLHVFRGHCGEILDLSWSKNNCLLSSSVDKNVRLWRVGVDQCLKIFFHSDYVTCIQFNPVNDDYFISGSIDGKVRIWEINSCQVVDWIESRDIITAVQYCPDGKGGVFGSITGTCRFFNISDNHFKLESEMCLATKKKLSPCKRITGFQFLPQDPSKVLVTCADSQVRIIDGLTVISKYKGLRNARNQISASFTSDGKHIISASENSNIYIWNHNDQEHYSFFHPKANKSFECFSSDATIAISWPGLKTGSPDSLPFSPPTRFSLSQDFHLESNLKGSATWPEEKLPKPVPNEKSRMGKSQYKFFKNSCQNLSDSHAWGLVIVTAGLDGRIRSFHNYGLPAPL